MGREAVEVDEVESVCWANLIFRSARQTSKLLGFAVETVATDGVDSDRFAMVETDQDGVAKQDGFEGMVDHGE